MPSKKELIEKLVRKPMPADYKLRELDTLMGKCGCKKIQGGRGSGIRYVHEKSGESLAFDAPHGGNALYRYHIKDAIEFLRRIGEI